MNILEPRATEKSYLEQTNRTYVFPVKKSASKQEIAKMVEKEFNVTVTEVRTLIRKGKKTRFSKGKHAYPGITHRQDKKFAQVRLKKGDSIKVFDEPEKEDNTNQHYEENKATAASLVKSCASPYILHCKRSSSLNAVDTLVLSTVIHKQPLDVLHTRDQKNVCNKYKYSENTLKDRNK